MNWKELLRTMSALAHNNIAIAVVGAILAAAGIAVILLRRFRKKKPRKGIPWYERMFTFLAIGLGTGMDADGMWTAFRDELHMTFGACVILFAFLPVVLINLAMKARRNLIDSPDDHLSTGREGKAMWVIAATSAMIASSTAENLTSFLTRLGAPLVVAWLWHQEIVSERAIQRGSTGQQVAGMLKQWMVRIGLSAPPAGSLTEIDAARRIAKLATWAYRFNTGNKLVSWIAERRWDSARTRPAYQRILTNPHTRVQYRLLLLDLYRQRDATSKDGVEKNDEWEMPEWATRPQISAPRRPAATASAALPQASPTDAVDDDPAPRLSAADDEPVLDQLRRQYPAEVPSIGAVKRIAGGLSASGKCSQSRAIRLRDRYVDEMQAAQTA